MLKRTLLIILLIMSLVTAGAARAPFRQDEKPDGAVEKKLTPEEEGEARALAEEFIKRLEQEEDI
ncbi:MAG: hypothetical protein JO360_10020, partial [Acidobacteria bacterium]|nr:hypothetical protein [Acidobacteriota bacterium]